ncbi:MAG: acyltransferase [Vicinamibacteria bacterium]
MTSAVRWFTCLPVGGLLLLRRAKLIAFPTASRYLAFIPGSLGALWRGEWYERTLESCGPGLYVDWMAVIKTPRTRIGKNVYVGEFCHVGWAEIGDDTLLGGHITVLSGRRHHRFERLDIPMARQGGELTLVKIGSDVWIGNGAIVMADVAPGSVVAAGAVVTKTFEPYAVLAGVPARLVRSRASGRDETVTEGA